MVHDLHAGGVIDIRLAETPSGDIAGLYMLHVRELPKIQDAAYIALIAVEESFRGQRVGDFLLGDGLKIISRARSGQMPVVWAMIDPANQSSHKLFERHGFDRVIPAQTPGNESHYDWRLRLAGVPV
jgi:ribosomal protein S18 acetylase RimI-like enzyme